MTVTSTTNQGTHTFAPVVHQDISTRATEQHALTVEKGATLVKAQQHVAHATAATTILEGLAKTVCLGALRVAQVSLAQNAIWVTSQTQQGQVAHRVESQTVPSAPVLVTAQVV